MNTGTASLTYKPAVIIGAGRSGTNMLRDVLCQLPRWGTWPCDEINYIWRYGNAGNPTDELTVEQARPEVVRYIRKAMGSLAQKNDLMGVVEKTCANALRVPFVNAVLPEAKFVHIVRDGRDVVDSAMQRWLAPLDLPYVLKKARYVPAADLPFYAQRYLRDRLYRLRSEEKRLGAWGPRFEGMTEALEQHSLAEVCALQWQRCVELASESLALLPADQVWQVRYEDFVTDPAAHMKALCGFLGIPTDSIDLGAVTAGVSPRSVGKGRKRLSAEQMAAVERLLHPTLDAFEYEVAP